MPGSAGSNRIRRASAGGTATIARRAVTTWCFDTTRTPPRIRSIRCTGVPSFTREPSRRASRCAISCEPPTNRNICAPSRVLKLRSNVPMFRSSPDDAM